MKRLITPLATSLMMASCGVPQRALTVYGADAPDEKCVFEGEPTVFQSHLVLDTDLALGLIMGLSVGNNLTQAEVVVSEDRIWSPNNHITPLRYEARWECDSTGFAATVGPLILPAFDPELPYCLDKRDEVSSFSGVDILSASGGAIVPGGRNAVIVTAVQQGMGVAVDQLFDIAVLADRCCREPGTNCEGNDLGKDSCRDLQAIFETLSPELRVGTTQPGTPSEDLQRFAAFSMFDGEYRRNLGANLPSSVTYADLPFSPRYPLRLRGVLEGVMGDGSLVQSNDLAMTVEICRQCGPLAASRNFRRSYYESAEDDPATGRGKILSSACNID